MLTLAAAILTLQGACQRQAAPPANADRLAPRSTLAQGAPSIELADAQLGAVRIERIRTLDFTIESETVGNISLDEDPSVVQAESALVSAAAASELAGLQLARIKGLGEANGIASKDIEASLAAQETAAATLLAARHSVRALGISDQEIDRMVRSGRVEEKGPAGVHRAWVVANIPESDSPHVHVGQTLLAMVPAFPARWYTGRVTRVYATLDPATHRLTVRGLLQDPNEQLRAGMLATVVIQFDEPMQALAIPTTAAVRETDGSMVAWVTSDRHRFSMRTLALGMESHGHYQVLDGLKVNELVVVEGGVFLSNMLDAPPSD